MSDDLVQGGQGRTAQEVSDSALGIIGVAGICVVIALLLSIFAVGCA